MYQLKDVLTAEQSLYFFRCSFTRNATTREKLYALYTFYRKKVDVRFRVVRERTAKTEIAAICRSAANGPILLKNSGPDGKSPILCNIDSRLKDCVNHCCARHFILIQILPTRIGWGVFQKNRAVCNLSASRLRVVQSRRPASP